MSDTNTETKPAKPAKAATAKPAKPTKPEKKDADKGEKKTGPRGVGVIAEIVKCMSRAKGANVSETVEHLVKKFPDRNEEGMTTTAKIQLNKKCTSKEKDEKRGMVYSYDEDEAAKAAKKK
jgi:hypothetical protein